MIIWPAPVCTTVPHLRTRNAAIGSSLLSFAGWAGCGALAKTVTGQCVQEPQVNPWIALSLIGCCGGLVWRSQEHLTGMAVFTAYCHVLFVFTRPSSYDIYVCILHALDCTLPLNSFWTISFDLWPLHLVLYGIEFVAVARVALGTNLETA